MCFLDYIGVRKKKRIAHVKQSLKTIKKKKKRDLKRIRLNKYPDISPDVEECILKQYKLAPPATIIDWAWNTSDARNWLELPQEVTLRIFMKMDTVDIVLTVSQVCSSWRNLSKEPILYRSVVIGGYKSILRRKRMRGFVKIAYKAVERSCGKLEHFWCGNMDLFFKNDLQHIVESSPSLRSLRMGLCRFIEIEDLVEIIKKIPSLEEIYLKTWDFLDGIIQDIGRSCRKLMYAQFGVVSNLADEKAIEIANSLPYLRRLWFHGNDLTNKGLQAILSGCPQLEYIYLQGVSALEDDLLKKHCERIQSITVLSKDHSIFGDEREIQLKATPSEPFFIKFSNILEETGYRNDLSLMYRSSFETLETIFDVKLDIC